MVAIGGHVSLNPERRHMNVKIGLRCLPGGGLGPSESQREKRVTSSAIHKVSRGHYCRLRLYLLNTSLLNRTGAGLYAGRLAGAAPMAPPGCAKAPASICAPWLPAPLNLICPSTPGRAASAPSSFS